MSTGWGVVHKFMPLKKQKLLAAKSQTGWKNLENLELDEWKVYPKIIHRWGPIDHTWSKFLEGVLVKQKPNLPYEIILYILGFAFKNKKTVSI